MTSKQGYNPDFSEFLNSKVELSLKDNRKITGVVESADHFMNMVVNDAKEINGKGETRDLFKAIVRGNQIVNWSFLN